MDWKKHLERILNNFTSREFVAWIVACFALWDNLIDMKLWMYITLGFMGVRTVQKINQWKLNGRSK